MIDAVTTRYRVTHRGYTSPGNLTRTQAETLRAQLATHPDTGTIRLRIDQRATARAIRTADRSWHETTTAIRLGII